MKQFYLIIISLLLIILVILGIGPNNIINSFKTASLEWIIVALFIHLLSVGVKSIRWGFIINKPFEFKNNYIVKTIGLFAGNFSPLRTAGEVMNALAGKKLNKITLHEGLSAGLTERFFDLLIVGILLLLSAILIEKIRYLAILGASLSLIGVLIIYFINWKEDASIKIYKKIHSYLSKLHINEDILENIYLKFTEGLKGMTGYTNAFTSSINLSYVSVLAMISWLLECLRLYVVLYAFNVEINFVSVIIILLLADIISIVSLLPGGIGSFELSLTGLFIIFGVPGALAGSVAITDRLVSFWAVSVLGLIFSSYYAKGILEEMKNLTLDLGILKKK